MNRFTPHRTGQGTDLIGNREKATVHIAKAQLGLTEKEYREALTIVGVTTSKDLTFRQFYRLMENFKADGFRPCGERRRKPFVQAPAAPWDKKPMLQKIAATLGDLGLQWRYADAIAVRMFGVDAVSWCTPEQLHNVVAALEYKKNKENREHQQTLTGGGE